MLLQVNVRDLALLDSLLRIPSTMDTHPCRRKDKPSFSSTLLDVIYRSIEDERDHDKSSPPVVNYRKAMRINRQISIADSNDHPSSSRGSKKNLIGDHVVVDRRGIASSSSEIYGFPARLRPIRTVNIHDDDDEEMNIMNTSTVCDKKYNKSNDDLQTKADGDQGKFVKAKSRAMKIYGYLKRGKQPISPGGRLATFLVSLFRTTNVKKSKPYDHDEAMIVHANLKSKSSSSSATSFSRSCLSKTPPSSSRGKPNGTGSKRSVRFCPASGDGSDPPTTMNEELKKHNILKTYQRKRVEYVFDSINNNNNNSNNNNDEDEEEEEDEGGSYASSDLFELDHLSAIGMDQCMQELPLYETTNVDVNRAIANGLLV